MDKLQYSAAGGQKKSQAQNLIIRTEVLRNLSSYPGKSYAKVKALVGMSGILILCIETSGLMYLKTLKDFWEALDLQKWFTSLVEGQYSHLLEDDERPLLCKMYESLSPF